MYTSRDRSDHVWVPTPEKIIGASRRGTLLVTDLVTVPQLTLLLTNLDTFQKFVSVTWLEERRAWLEEGAPPRIRRTVALL